MENEEPVMYILVNKGLNMKKGKTAAQVAHSAVKAAHYAETKSEYWADWFGKSYTKIVLEASEFEMKELISKYRSSCFETYDPAKGAFAVCSFFPNTAEMQTFERNNEHEGRTQIKKGSLTTLAFVPLPKSKCPEELRKLKLLD